MAYSEVDLLIGTAGPQVVLRRTHNNTDERRGIFGSGWRTNLEEEITEVVATQISETGGGIAWTRQDGRVDSFLTATQSPSMTVYRPTDGRHDRVVKYSDRYEATDTANILRRFSLTGKLVEVRDRRGLGFSIGRDSQERVRDITHTTGPSLHLDYDASGRVTGARTSDGTSVTYGYDTSGRLVSATKAGGVTWQYGYDAEGRLFEVKDPAGVVVYEADLFAGQVVAQRDGNGNGQSMTYLPDPSQTPTAGAGIAVTTDQFGKTMTDTFDRRGFVTSSVDQEGSRTLFSYNQAGDRTEVTDAVGSVWRTTYDQDGNPTEIKDPTGAVFSSQYRSDFQPSSTTDPTGVSTYFSYDEFGTLTSVNTGGHTTVFIPDQMGNISATISPDGLITRTEYDSLGRPIRRIDPGGRDTLTFYNRDGTVSATVAPGGATTYTFYDEAGRPVRVVDPLGGETRFSYDSSGNQVSVVDPAGQETRFGYDPAYNLYEASTTIEGGRVIRARYGYDKANRLVSVSYPGGGRSHYTYGPTGRVVAAEDPDGARWEYSYTPGGELAEARAPDGVTTRYAYDPAGRLISQSNDKELALSFVYDRAGRLVAVTSASGASTEYSYDQAGRLVGEAVSRLQPEPGVRFVVTSTLSPGGRRVATFHGRYSANSQTGNLVPLEPATRTTYTYADDGSLSAIASQRGGSPTMELTFTYDPQTGRLSSSYSQAHQSSFSYDLLGRPTELTFTTQSGTLSYPTRYDPAGRVIEKAGSFYSYDRLGRLVSAYDKETDTTWTYTYDDDSNRQVAQNDKGYTQSLSFDQAGRITSPGFVYDASGRVISDTTPTGKKRHYIWDGYSRLTGIDVYDPQTGSYENVRYSYDPFGRIASKTTYLDFTYPTEVLFFHYHQDRLIAEEDEEGITREYLYTGDGAPLAMRSRNQDGTYSIYFFLADTHGDVVALLDSQGQITNRYAYGPWGEATRVSEQVHQPFRYAGYYYEPSADLYWLRARWYDPGTGRFLSKDPVMGSRRNLRSLNRYAYAECAPTSVRDPSGMSPRCSGGRSVLDQRHGRNMMRHYYAYAKAAHNSKPVVPLEVILGVIYEEGGEKFPLRRIGGELAYLGWIPDWVPLVPGREDANVGPMAVSRGMARKIGESGENLMHPRHNIFVGTAYLNYRYGQGMEGGLLSTLGDPDVAWTLVYFNYVNWEKEPPEWDVAGTLADPLFRNFCARLPTIRSNYF